MHNPKPPFKHSCGPRIAKIALVGEAHGETEERTGLPFMGASGQELTRMLSEAGIKRGDCFITNTLAFRPPDNNIESLCVKKGELDANYSHPPISLGKYLRPEFLGELDRLKLELEEVRPNIVIALGNVACWALLRTSGISSIRGTCALSTLIPEQKVLPTFHPSAVLRQWANRPIVLADLMKARRASGSPALDRPSRIATIDPLCDEIAAWYEGKGGGPAAPYAPLIAVDIETTRGQIDTIGFATSPRRSLSIRFFSKYTYESFFPTIAEEVEAWMWVQKFLLCPGKKVLQNGLYDMQYLLRMGLRLHNVAEDTMLLHHALYPELQKGLGFLGSIYTDEASWKLLNRNKEGKKDD